MSGFEARLEEAQGIIARILREELSEGEEMRLYERARALLEECRRLLAEGDGKDEEIDGRA
ncbi:MAG TPA: exodeoxyribonuclease VII small subunit [archaeon]|nr:exodeoxyribonuclease VII small subunit [archaeon]